MKRIGMLLTVSALAALGAREQTNVTTTGGTPGNLAKFTGSATVGDSSVVELNGLRRPSLRCHRACND